MMRNSFSTERQKQIQSIPSSKDIDRIRRSIKSKLRDLLLFDLAVETGVTASQLLQLKIKDLTDLNVGDEILVLTGKQKRNEPVTMGPKTYKSFQHYILKNRPGLNDPLFKSRKGKEALSLPSASRLVSSWFERVGLEGMSGFLSLRKTWETRLRKPKTEKISPLTPESPYSINSIQTPTMQELAYKELERAIVTARIKPGERLVAEKLAKQMGISTIPIREAIGRLEARNFVTVQPKKGAAVNALSEENLKEMLEIRFLLELPAARKAAAAATQDTIETIKRLNHRYISAQQKNDADMALSANREFHFTIYKGANMPILLAMIENLWDQVSPYYHLMFRQTLFHDPHTGTAYHKKIIQGMVANDPREVSKWLEIDLSESAAFVADVMRKL
ncbi:FCD domain-containing protein [Desulfococcaceae bacterium HSG9]|nr:FCD domain-containing protein [Desulfococcaceae bacterium HSG9]